MHENLDCCHFVAATIVHNYESILELFLSISLLSIFTTADYISHSMFRCNDIPMLNTHIPAFPQDRLHDSQAPAYLSQEGFCQAPALTPIPFSRLLLPLSQTPPQYYLQLLHLFQGNSFGGVHQMIPPLMQLRHVG
jgi:hypothetical protein